MLQKKNSKPKNICITYFSLAWASEGAPEPFPLAYIGFLVGLLGLVAESRVMNVLVGTELREQPRRPL